MSKKKTHRKRIHPRLPVHESFLEESDDEVCITEEMLSEMEDPEWERQLKESEDITKFEPYYRALVSKFSDLHQERISLNDTRYTILRQIRRLSNIIQKYCTFRDCMFVDPQRNLRTRVVEKPKTKKMNPVSRDICDAMIPTVFEKLHETIPGFAIVGEGLEGEHDGVYMTAEEYVIHMLLESLKTAHHIDSVPQRTVKQYMAKRGGIRYLEEGHAYRKRSIEDDK
jgi:hypothetical protein